MSNLKGFSAVRDELQRVRQARDTYKRKLSNEKARADRAEHINKKIAEAVLAVIKRYKEFNDVDAV